MEIVLDARHFRIANTLLKPRFLLFCLCRGSDDVLWCPLIMPAKRDRKDLLCRLSSESCRAVLADDDCSSCLSDFRPAETCVWQVRNEKSS